MLLRKEGEIFEPNAYFARKRKIATSIGSNAEFFLNEFFNKYKIQPSQYEVISTKPEDTPIVLSNNNVDGVSIYEPFAYFAEQRTGTDKIFKIPEPGLYAEIIVISAIPEWVDSHKGSITKFLRALQKAERFSREHPEESINIISSFTKLDKEALGEILNKYTPGIILEKKLVSYMEEQAEWAKNTGKTAKDAATPNFRDIIFDAPLKKLAPSAVQL